MALYLENHKMPEIGKKYLVEINYDGSVRDAIDNRISGFAKDIGDHGDLVDRRNLIKNLADLLSRYNAKGLTPSWNDAVLLVLEEPAVIEEGREEE